MIAASLCMCGFLIFGVPERNNFSINVWLRGVKSQPRRRTVPPMCALPTEVEWRRFVCVLRKLGYAPQQTKRGSVRTFRNPNRNPGVISFREPHPGGALGHHSLRVCLRKLALSPEDFLRLLEDC